jgi:hypothetical protein
MALMMEGWLAGPRSTCAFVAKDKNTCGNVRNVVNRSDLPSIHAGVVGLPKMELKIHRFAPLRNLTAFQLVGNQENRPRHLEMH